MGIQAGFTIHSWHFNDTLEMSLFLKKKKNRYNSKKIITLRDVKGIRGMEETFPSFLKQQLWLLLNVAVGGAVLTKFAG